jgi:site-specific recombinase XerD
MIWARVHGLKLRGGSSKVVQQGPPHTLHHSFATDLYRETSKIRLVQKVLGHSDLSTTMIYTHIFDEEVESALKSFRQAGVIATAFHA